MRFCRKELGMDLKHMQVEERDYFFWVKAGDCYARIERRFLDDYFHGDRNGIGRAGLLGALLNSRKK